MRTKKAAPLDRLAVTDAAAKAKVAAVLAVLSGEKAISEVCRETGLQPLQYYKLETRLVEAMVATAGMPSSGRRRRSPVAEAATLAEKTEQLRQEHRRMQCLLRVSRKLLRPPKRARKGPGRPPKASPPQAQTVPVTAVKKPIRPTTAAVPPT